MHPALIPEARLPGYVGTNKYPETATTCSDFRSLPLEQWGLKRAHHPLVACASTITTSRQRSCRHKCLLFRSLPPRTPPWPLGQLESCLCLAGAEGPTGASNYSHVLLQK